MLRVGIDGIAEQKQLHHRQGDDHPQGERIAANLDPLFPQNCQKSAEGKPVHASPPGFWLSRWMNTSSSFAATSCQTSESASADMVACSSALWSVPAIRKT